MCPRQFVTTAVPLEPFVVSVVFADGDVRDVDVEPLVDGPVFGPLGDAGIGRVTRRVDAVGREAGVRAH